MTNILYQKALEYASRNYSVIPLRKDKRPLLGEGKNIVFQRERIASDEEIEAWWIEHPSANVGICTGKISGLTVVDIDRGHSDGRETALETFPPTYTIATPSGGFQLYYQYDSSIQQTAGTFSQFPHVDIRNDGGYVVAPPSHCDYVKYGKKIAGDYTILKNIDIAPFPREMFTTSSSVSKEKVSAILTKLDTMAEGSGRNNALAAVIGKIVSLVPPKDRATIGYSMAVAANAQFKQPLEEKEVKTIFNSILKREAKKPLAEIEFLRTDKGIIIANEENVYRTIEHDPKLSGLFRMNLFTGLVETLFERKDWSTLQNVNIIGVQTYLMRTYPHFPKITAKIVEAAVLHYAYKHEVSPPYDWLKSLVWDQTPRLDSWLTSVYGVENSPYHVAIGSNWMKGLVKRIVEPGSKFDYVLVLEGKQGTKKSTSLATLGGAWHVETVFTPENKDFFMLLSGNLIVEFSEGETLSRSEVKKLKAVITMQNDKYRPPYDKAPRNFPRQCVFAMTTNETEYLKDDTGNRRWLPVECQKIADIDWLAANKDQLYAEAYHRVVFSRETTYEFPDEDMKVQQDRRRVADPREELIFEWYFGTLSAAMRLEGITTRDAWQVGVNKNATFGSQMTKLDSIIIGSILRNALHLERKNTMVNGVRLYRYFPTEQTHILAPKQADGTPVPAFMEF